MNEFRQNFVREFIGPLYDLHARISVENSTELRHQAFRLIHTVKGCSRTFGLEQTAGIAAGIENILAEEEFGEAPKDLLLERIALLIETLKSPGVVTPVPDYRARPANGSRAVCVCRLPAPLYDRMTESERSALVAALAAGRRVSLVNRSVDLSTFADEFRRVRGELEASGELIAALPDPNAAEPLSGFVFLVTNDSGPSASAELSETIGAPLNRDAQFSQLLEGIADHIDRVAAEADKAVGLTIAADDRALDPALAKPVFELLIHLASNAVDHGIQRAGKIEISILQDGDSVVITFADNGRGIVTEETSGGAEGALARIFEPEYSAGSGKNSGRGYGLSIVATEVAKLNGKISVKTRKDFGTRFEIVLPF